MSRLRHWIVSGWVPLVLWALPAPATEPVRVLFLGDQGHHQPARRAEQLIPALAERGITIQYTGDAQMLAPESLEPFDGLIFYANTTEITPAQEKALLDYVARGRGLIALHCASYCFLNSDKYVALVGAQFKEHGTGVFTTLIAEPDHPLMKGFEGFASWDETYVHHRHNEQGRTVLEYRVGDPQAKGTVREPWTWVRQEGKGRVFYTAWGHDERTWSNPGFLNLVERGIRWACGRDLSRVPAYRDPELFHAPTMTQTPADAAPFDYVDVGDKIPNYTAGAKWGTQGESYSRMQKPLGPEESRRHYVTPVGFELRLYASEKDFDSKPIAMNWDHRGRLWVCETVDYPNNLQAPGQGNDRIRICDDSDGDGVADKFTLFADKLSIPTAIVCSHGGAIVQNGTETLFLKDTDGDDQADVRQVLISNWTLGDTHGGVSNFQFGHDNWIWGIQGYNPSEPIIQGVKQPRFSMGFFRFRVETENEQPVVTAIEFLKSAYGNTWGLGFSEEGLVFGSSANGHPSLYMPIPNRYYEHVRGWTPSLLAATIADSPRFVPITDKVRQVDHHGAYSAASGHALYTARNYPRQYWNRTAFVCGPEGHLVGTFVLRADGTDFHSTSPCNLVASDDEWAAPIMAEVGPDGNVWIIDWYNYIVQHNPTPVGFENGKGNAYESDLRDKRHGRIYRLVYTGPTDLPPQPAPKLDPGHPAGLVAVLGHSTMHVRLQAQRLLVERNQTDAAPALHALARSAESSPLAAQHAINTLAGLGALSTPDGSETIRSALKHPAWGVRRAALLALPADYAFPADRLADPHPHVRLAALLALADRPADSLAPAVVDPLVTMAADPDVHKDRWLPDAVTSAAAVHSEAFLGQVIASSTPQIDRSAAAPIVRIVAEHRARKGLSDEALNGLLASLQHAPAPLTHAVLAGFVKGWPKNRPAVLLPATEQALAAALPNLGQEGRVQLLRLADVFQSTALREEAKAVLVTLAETIQDASRSDQDRLESARQLIELSPSDAISVDQLLSAITVQASPELTAGLIDALRGSTANNLGPEVVERISAWTPATRTAALRLLLARPETARVLLKGIEKNQASWSDLSLDQQQGLVNHPDQSLAARAIKLMEAGGGLPDPDREKVLQRLLPLTERSGDVARGKETYQRHCAKCHRHGELGENVGPNLTGMAVHPKAELLLNIIDPSRSVESNFRAYTIALADGRVQNGLLAAESKSAIEVVDSEGKRHSIAREDIDEIIPSKKSFMPEGFEKQMKEEEIVDLLEFLAARGKFVPLDLRRAATVITTRGMFTAESADVERLIFPDWSPKSVDGIPFLLIDPQGDRVPNAIMLKGQLGEFPPRMPESVRMPVGQSAQAIHILGGVGGWNYPAHRDKSVSMIVRLRYDSGETEDHELINGEHLADYISRVDVPGSKLAFMLRGQQIRYLAVTPKRKEPIRELELVKGPDPTAPVVMAVTVESP